MRPESKLGARPHFDERDLPQISSEIEKVLRSGRLILGPHTVALEEEFAAYIGTKHAVAVSSCSAALEIVLRTLDSAGREVVVPANTFVATANAAMRAVVPSNTCVATPNAVRGAGGRVTLLDCDEDGNFDFDAAFEAEGRPVAVYVAGLVPRSIERVSKFEASFVEDCAHAHGATYKGKKLGSLGVAGCFSFYPTKVMTSGVGGMITTDSDAIANAARSMRHHGQSPVAGLEDIVSFGSNWLMSEVHAVLARAQLRRLPEMLARRREVAEAYDEALLGTCLLSPHVTPSSEPAWYKYPVMLPEDSDRDIARFFLLKQFGIETGALYWPPVHRMPAYAGAAMPRTEAILKRRLCLPMHALVDPEDCREIVLAAEACAIAAKRAP